MNDTSPRQQKLVLNVDDRPTSLYTRDRLLRLEGYIVANASNGKEAITLAERLHPDLILLDVHLPDMDGREICRQIKANPELQAIPVILASTTMRGDAAQFEAMHWAGADAFIAEPFDLQALTSTLKAVLKDERR